MKDFKFDYDSENDSLFVYLENSKSNGAIEMGNFVLDFDEKGNLVAMEILEVSNVFKTVLSKMIELNQVKEFKAEMFNFRNMASIKFSIGDGSKIESANIMIPRVIEKSPAINY